MCEQLLLNVNGLGFSKADRVYLVLAGVSRVSAGSSNWKVFKNNLWGKGKGRIAVVGSIRGKRKFFL